MVLPRGCRFKASCSARPLPTDSERSMDDAISRRDLLKTMAIAGAGATVPGELLAAAATASRETPAASPLTVRTTYATGDIVELYSTSDVFTPARGRSFMKFSFDFAEPGVTFGNHRFSILVFTEENTYSLDRTRMKAEGNDERMRLTCDRFVWAGGQETAPGKVTVEFRK